ncbi:hypothetical protein F5I97DRAFT_1927938 [Phlebopus sp. FC_14]|nr:hypothetical protein F5I97DRAFT_1927938 [Phlebopus sp. FC_14]
MPLEKRVDENQDDPAFAALPPRLRRRIDDVFDVTASSLRTRHTRSSEDETAPGGFIVEDVELAGFLVEDGPVRDSPTSSIDARIQLSSIPHALHLLNINPDDEILAVFKNAASGWGARSTHGEGVGKKDWRAVCAVLIEAEGDAADEDDVEMGEDESGPDSDEYRMSDVSSELKANGISSDEYEGEVLRGKTKRNLQKTARKQLPGQLNAQQKAECREDFARFFPNVPDVELDEQRIMIKDISRVANLLKEKLKAEEILEMLETFSSSAEKSMSLEDFERMMVMTKLVK